MLGVGLLNRRIWHCANHFHSQSHLHNHLFRSLWVRLELKKKKTANTWTVADSPVTSFCRHACLAPQQEQILVTENRKPNRPHVCAPCALINEAIVP